METLTQGETPALLQMDVKDFAALIPLLVDTSITLGKSSAVESQNAAQLPLRATLEADGEIVLSREKSPLVMAGDWVWQQRCTARPAGGVEGILHAPVRCRVQVPQFLSRHWPQLRGRRLEANFKLEDFTRTAGPAIPAGPQGRAGATRALLQCAYGSRIMTVGVTAADETVWLPDPGAPTRYSTRDFAAERAALGRLQRSGFSGPDASGKLQLAGQNSVLNFLAREFPKLQREWSVTLDEQLENRTLKNIERVEPRFQITAVGRAMV